MVRQVRSPEAPASLETFPRCRLPPYLPPVVAAAPRHRCGGRFATSRLPPCGSAVRVCACARVFGVPSHLPAVETRGLPPPFVFPTRGLPFSLAQFCRVRSSKGGGRSNGLGEKGFGDRRIAILSRRACFLSLFLLRVAANFRPCRLPYFPVTVSLFLSTLTVLFRRWRLGSLRRYRVGGVKATCRWWSAGVAFGSCLAWLGFLP